MSRRDPAASRSTSSARGRAAGARARTDGKVDVQCPQCAAGYRISSDQLDSKIECSECHRVFFAKTTAGKRVAAPDNTKVYVGFGVGALALIGIFVLASSSPEKPKEAPPPPAPKAPAFSVGDHPRTHQIVKWGRSLSDGNQLILRSHTDFAAFGKELGVASSEPDEVLKAMQTHESTKFLRELQCDSGELASSADMDSATGKANLFVTPKAGDDTYLAKYRGELVATFRMDGETVKITSLTVKQPPVRNPQKPDPSKQTYIPNKDINKPAEIEIHDSAGTRKVKESQPAAVPHWSKATPEQQKKADDTVAMLLESANPEAPGNLFNKATMSIQTLDDKKAVVPRVLNKMFELYSDVNGNNIRLSQLDRALRGWTGFAVNYDPTDSGDAGKDKAARESCVRQWFAFWYRYANGELKEFLEESENLDMPVEDPKKKKPAK